MKLLVGADPEFFVSLGNQPISAHDLVPGTKDKPHKLSKGAVQADGTAIEFNIDPAETKEQFVSNIETTLKDIRSMVPGKFEFNFTPSVLYPKDYFDKLPEYSKELGCNPDFNARTGRVNPPPGTGGAREKYPTMRTGAGHIHIGWTNGADVKDQSHMWDCCEVVKQLDKYFGPYSRVWDKDHRRQELYGAEGAFRPKPYGVEYRVLSNAWLKYPKLWPWIFDSVRFIMQRRFVEGSTGTHYKARVRPEIDTRAAVYRDYVLYDAEQSARYRFGHDAPAFPLDFKEAA